MDQVIAMLTGPVAMFAYGGLAIGLFFVFFYLLVLKPRREGETFEFETFEKGNLSDMAKTFNLEGFRSNAKLIHGHLNYIGNVQKWIRKEGKHAVLKYSKTSDGYDPEAVVREVPKLDKNGKQMLDKNGKPISYKATVEKEIPYDLFFFKVKGDGWFETSYYIIADTKFVKFDAKSDTYMIDENVQICPFGGVYVTSKSGERYLYDVSFRKSIENNMTYIQNYSGKIIYLETQHAKSMSRLLGKHIAKGKSYQAFATETLMKDGTDTDDGEDET